MLANYLTTAWRYLLRDKGVSLISVLSLTLGLACALLVFVFLQQEWVRDDFHVNGDRIFRVVMSDAIGENEWELRSAMLSPELGLEMKRSYPEIEETVRFRNVWGRLRRDDFTTRMNAMAFTDSTFFTTLSFEIMHGDRHPLTTPNEIVLTAKTAKRFADDGDIADLIGKRIVYFNPQNKMYDLTVTAIAYDPTYRSSLQFTALLPWELTKAGLNESGVPFSDRNAMTFIMLKSPQDRKVIEDGLPELSKQVFATDEDELRGSGKWSKEESPFALHLHQYGEMHKEGLMGGNVLSIMPPILIYIVGILGGLVLLVGCVNFTILSLGRSTHRTREIGLRKVSGASRSHLIGQHVVEAVFLCAVSVVAGAALANYLKPEMASLFYFFPNYALDWSHTPLFWAFMILLPLVVGSVAGFYPAFALSRVEAVSALKGLGGGGGKNRFARFLVIVQFAAATFLLASTQVVLRQIDYTNTFDRGYDPSLIFVIDPNSEDFERLYDRYRSRVMALPGVENVAGTQTTIGGGFPRNYEIKEPEVQMFHSSVTPEFLDTYGLELLEGRNLRVNGPVDEVLVNEFMVEKMGWDNPIGQTVPFEYDDIDHPHVVGVVKDFFYLHGAAPMFPLVLHQNPAMQKARVAVRMKPDLIGETVPQLEEIWKEVAPDAPSTLFTLDVIIERNMEDATNLLRPLGYTASIFGIIISCLGLFGLAIHTLARRTKEVGVRKVLGASIPSVFALLTRRLIALAIIGCILGSVASHFTVKLILDMFSNQVPVGVHFFLIPSLGILVLSLLSVFYHTLKTAWVDPTEELQHE